MNPALARHVQRSSSWTKANKVAADERAMGSSESRRIAADPGHWFAGRSPS